MQIPTSVSSKGSITNLRRKLKVAGPRSVRDAWQAVLLEPGEDSYGTLRTVIARAERRAGCDRDISFVQICLALLIFTLAVFDARLLFTLVLALPIPWWLRANYYAAQELMVRQRSGGALEPYGQ